MIFGSERLGRSRSFDVDASIHERLGRRIEMATFEARTPSMSRLTSSRSNGVPVAWNTESTICSAVNRRGAGAMNSGLVSDSVKSVDR